jgi:hypothetical protein
VDQKYRVLKLPASEAKLKIDNKKSVIPPILKAQSP